MANDGNAELGTKSTELVKVDPRQHLASAIRQFKNEYSADIYQPTVENAGESPIKPEILNEKLSRLIKSSNRLRDDANNFLNRDYAGLTEAEKTEIAESLADMRHDLLVVTTPMQSYGMGIPNHEYILNPIITSFPVRVIERAARTINQETAREAVDPRLVSRNVYDFFKAFMLEETGKEITLNFTATSYANFIGDTLDFEAALFNVVRNAQKIICLGKGDRINITAFNNESGDFVIEVRDNAGGFEKDLLEEVTIEEDGQVVKTQKAFQREVSRGQAQGSGLGLDIARTIAEKKFGGKIAVRNERFPGSDKQGAVVSFTFSQLAN